MQKMVNKTEKNEQATNMHVPLVDADSVNGKRGGGRGGSGEKYPKYRIAIAPHVDWLKSQILSSKDGIIRVRNKDIAGAMGPQFKNLHPTSIYWGLRYVLFKQQIIVGSGEDRNKQKLLTMRMRTDSDRLPESLEKAYREELMNTNRDKPDSKVKSVPEPEVTVGVIQPETMIRGMKRIVTAIRLSEIEEEVQA